MTPSPRWPDAPKTKKKLKLVVVIIDVEIFINGMEHALPNATDTMGYFLP